jgi:hypothetical protein
LTIPLSYTLLLPLHTQTPHLFSLIHLHLIHQPPSARKHTIFSHPPSHSPLTHTNTPSPRISFVCFTLSPSPHTYHSHLLTCLSLPIITIARLSLHVSTQSPRTSSISFPPTARSLNLATNHLSHPHSLALTTISLPVSLHTQTHSHISSHLTILFTPTTRILHLATILTLLTWFH